MSHEITRRADGKDETAFVGAPGWTGLGQQLTEGATIAEWEVAAGMDWQIFESPVKFQTANAGLKIADDKKVLYRSDSSAYLATVGKPFKVVQPAQLLRVFEGMAATHGLHLNTAGTLFDGKRLWALAKLGKLLKLPGKDLLQQYFLMATACDGSLATIGKHTSERVVCNNTLGIALRDGRNELKLRHTSVFNPDNIRAEVSAIVDCAKLFAEQAERLAAIKVNAKQVDRVVSEVVKEAKLALPTPSASLTELEQLRASKPYMRIIQLFEGEGLGSQLASANGTAWGLVNGVSQYIDHEMKGKTPSHSMANALFGKGDDAKKLAVVKGLALA